MNILSYPPPARRSRDSPDASVATRNDATAMTQIKNVVLVHGEFMDGSGWRQVYELLTSDGFRVSVVQHPTLSLAGDVLTTLRALRAQDGPCVLVGHSYGGAVISEAGTDDDVAALVYVAAFAPDAGESVHDLMSGTPAMPPSRDGFLLRDRAEFHASFAADLPPAEARFMADAQVPWRVDALGGRVTRPAWRTKPSWYLVATDDHVIPPSAQRAMAARAGSTVREIAASHSVHVSQPHATADLIREASARPPPHADVVVFPGAQVGPDRSQEEQDEPDGGGDADVGDTGEPEQQAQGPGHLERAEHREPGLRDADPDRVGHGEFRVPEVGDGGCDVGRDRGDDYEHAENEYVHGGPIGEPRVTASHDGVRRMRPAPVERSGQPAKTKHAAVM